MAAQQASDLGAGPRTPEMALPAACKQHRAGGSAFLATLYSQQQTLTSATTSCCFCHGRRSCCNAPAAAASAERSDAGDSSAAANCGDAPLRPEVEAVLPDARRADRGSWAARGVQRVAAPCGVSAGGPAVGRACCQEIMAAGWWAMPPGEATGRQAGRVKAVWTSSTGLRALRDPVLQPAMAGARFIDASQMLCLLAASAPICAPKLCSSPCTVRAVVQKRCGSAGRPANVLPAVGGTLHCPLSRLAGHKLARSHGR